MTILCERDRDGLRLHRVRGFDEQADQFPPRMSDQFRLAVAAGRAALSARGASLQDVTRIVYLLKDTDGFSACAPFLHNLFIHNHPISTVMIVPEFDRPDVAIELELIARLPGDEDEDTAN